MPSSDLCSSDLSRRRHTRLSCDWSSDVCSPDRSEEHTSELQSHDNLVCRLLTCALPIRSEEHTSELQSHDNLVCRLLLENSEPGLMLAGDGEDPVGRARPFEERRAARGPSGFWARPPRGRQPAPQASLTPSFFN